MKPIFLLFIFLFALLSCNGARNDSDIQSEGFKFDLKNAYLTSPLILDSVQFAGGTSIYSLHGMLARDGEIKPYSIQTFGNPLSDNFTVKSTHPPVDFGFESSMKTTPKINCVLFVKNKVAEISWRLGTKWLFLRASIIGAN